MTDVRKGPNGTMQPHPMLKLLLAVADGWLRTCGSGSERGCVARA